MHTDSHAHHDHSGASHGTFKTYVTGFVLSIILTVIPFWLVMQPTSPHIVILAAIYGLALVQIIIHLICFLHMSTKSEQKWNNTAFAFTILVVIILIGGSVWIMTNANDNLMPKMPDLQHQN